MLDVEYWLAIKRKILTNLSNQELDVINKSIGVDKVANQTQTMM
jgi:hypothetical protein